MIPEYLAVGPQLGADGTQLPARSGKLGDAIVSELHPRLYEQAYRGNIFSLSVATAAAITAYTGGAAGTPQIAVWNPVGSGKNLIPICASFSNAVAASAAGTASWGLFFGQTAAITQATTNVPTNHQTLGTGGSVATGFKNVALTSSTALTNALYVGSYYWATAAGATLVTPGNLTWFDGLVIIPPGSMMALGGSAALTSATWVGSIVWEEAAV